MLVKSVRHLLGTYPTSKLTCNEILVSSIAVSNEYINIYFKSHIALQYAYLQYVDQLLDHFHVSSV